jgi:hypothetical protein
MRRLASWAATKGAVWYPAAYACTTSDPNDSSRPEIEPWHEAINNNNTQSKQAKQLGNLVNQQQQKPVPRGGISKRIQEISN